MNYKTLFKAGSVCLIVIGAFKASFCLMNLQPGNDTGRQVLEWMNNHKMDMDADLERKMYNFNSFFNVQMYTLTLAIGILNLILVRFFDTPGLGRSVVTFNAVLWILFFVSSFKLNFLPPHCVAAGVFVAAWFYVPKKILEL